METRNWDFDTAERRELGADGSQSCSRGSVEDQEDGFPIVRGVGTVLLRGNVGCPQVESEQTSELLQRMRAPDVQREMVAVPHDGRSTREVRTAILR